MFQRRVPVWVKHAPAPSIRGFAFLAGMEALARGVLVSVFPVVMYRAFQDATVVSEIYFAIGLCSLIGGLLVPWITRFVPRRWMYTFGCTLYLAGACLAIQGSPLTTAAALACNTIGVVVIFVCFNAYVLDYVAQIELGACETLRMFYSALAWTAGPVCGVWLLHWWAPAPFVISGFFALCLLVVFWVMRLGNGKLISRAKTAPANPLAFVGRFFTKPRLVTGWLFAVIRSCGWWVYVVYVPIFAVENGMSERLGGVMLSLSNALLFFTPLMLRWMRRRSVRTAVRIGFLGAGLSFVAAAFAAILPWSTMGLLMFGSVFLILLDISAG
ncbi:MAG: MFS transporter, partial [Hyphomicrobiaceae bacterium]